MGTNNMTQDTGDPLLTTVMEVPPSPPALLWGLDLESWLEDIESVLVPSPILEDSKCRSELPLLLDLDSVLCPTGEEPGDSDGGPGEAQTQVRSVMEQLSRSPPLPRTKQPTQLVEKSQIPLTLNSMLMVTSALVRITAHRLLVLDLLLFQKLVKTC
ncbi:DNA damage-inducible transcript 3 protein isoform X2 [Hemitrygon akajei]|uniref:DNA damage-inducible transcript 3 protein isoform X2 n=1 Tax=Hemitrygon akajei TaxID=2704970 RepID=UPI003BF95271